MRACLKTNGGSLDSWEVIWANTYLNGAVPGLDWNQLGASPLTGASGKTSVEKSWKQSNYVIWLAIAYEVVLCLKA